MGIYRLLNGFVYDGGHFEKRDVTFNSVNDGDKTTTIDCKSCYIIPGMIDIHTHGCVNVDFNNITEDGLNRVNNFFIKQGVTSWLASIVTDEEEKMLYSAKVINEYSKKDTNGCLGVHLEGPFLSKEYKGSMPGKYFKNFDYNFLKMFQKECDGAVKYVTIAPEIEGALEGIEKIRDLNMIVSIGHSAATYEQAMQAIINGVKVSTHTFNAMRLIHQHEPAIAGAALASDIYCEIICDGLHLHPHTVDMLMKIKGPSKLIAITDSIQAAGLEDGEYVLGAQPIVVINGDAKLKNENIRAGSTLTMSTALKNTMKYTNKRLEDILPLFIDNPADLFDPTLKSFTTQRLVNAVVLNETFEIKHVIQNGRLIF